MGVGGWGLVGKGQGRESRQRRSTGEVDGARKEKKREEEGGREEKRKRTGGAQIQLLDVVTGQQDAPQEHTVRHGGQLVARVQGANQLAHLDLQQARAILVRESRRQLIEDVIHGVSAAVQQESMLTLQQGDGVHLNATGALEQLGACLPIHARVQARVVLRAHPLPASRLETQTMKRRIKKQGKEERNNFSGTPRR